MKAKYLIKINGIFYKPGDELPKKSDTKSDKDAKDTDTGDKAGK